MHLKRDFLFVLRGIWDKVCSARGALVCCSSDLFRLVIFCEHSAAVFHMRVYSCVLSAQFNIVNKPINNIGFLCPLTLSVFSTSQSSKVLTFILSNSHI